WQPKGRYFDGTDDYIVLPANWMPSTGTIEMWVKFDLALSHHLFSSDDNEVSIYNSAGTNILFYYDGAARITSVPDWATNTFVHLVITYARNTTGYIYTNGTELGNGAIPDTAVTNVATRLGESSSGANDYTGTMGEVRIYNRALTPLEIQHNYLATKWRYR
ncbi:unnamed protein product, partial [marine sediment metagenome]